MLIVYDMTLTEPRPILGCWGGAPIEWRTLGQMAGGTLLLARDVLDAARYLPDCLYTSWAESAVRRWLGETFLDTAFTPEERARLCTVTLTTRGSVPTQDRVFLLSAEEAAAYLPHPADRLAPAAGHAPSEELRALTALLPFYGVQKSCWWWLRSPGPEPNMAEIVWSDGSICGSGHYVNYERGIRPAIVLR